LQLTANVYVSLKHHTYEHYITNLCGPRFNLRKNTQIRKTSNFELLIACGLFSFILALNHSRSQRCSKNSLSLACFGFHDVKDI
jgi:hypothetical protein